MSNSVQPPRRLHTRLPRPWDSPGKNTGVGCHFLLQCMKVKSEREVTQSSPTLSNPMDCSLPGSSIHGICQARVLEWGAIACSVCIHIGTVKIYTKHTYIFFPAKIKCILLGNSNWNEGGTKYIAHMILFRFVLWGWYSLPNFTNKEAEQSTARSRSHSYGTQPPVSPPAKSLLLVAPSGSRP